MVRKERGNTRISGAVSAEMLARRRVRLRRGIATGRGDVRALQSVPQPRHLVETTVSSRRPTRLENPMFLIERFIFFSFFTSQEVVMKIV